MRKRSKVSRGFTNSSFITGIAIVLVAVLLGSYFLDQKNLEHKELPYDTIIVNQDYYGPAKKENWHTIKLGSFSLETPVTFRFLKYNGIDSYVGRITNGIDNLTFDYGWYSNDLSKFDTVEGVRVSMEIINGRKIKIIRDLKEEGVVGMYTEDLDNDNRLSILCMNCQDLNEKVQMFRTLKF